MSVAAFTGEHTDTQTTQCPGPHGQGKAEPNPPSVFLLTLPISICFIEMNLIYVYTMLPTT